MNAEDRATIRRVVATKRRTGTWKSRMTDVHRDSHGHVIVYVERREHRRIAALARSML